MEIGQTVWVWNFSGELISGKFLGFEKDPLFEYTWLKIDIGSHIVFKKPDHVFTDRERAKAWQMLARIKRLMSKGLTINEIVHPDEKKTFEKVLELFPDKLLKK